MTVPPRKLLLPRRSGQAEDPIRRDRPDRPYGADLRRVHQGLRCQAAIVQEGDIEEPFLERGDQLHLRQDGSGPSEKTGVRSSRSRNEGAACEQGDESIFRSVHHVVRAWDAWRSDEWPPARGVRFQLHDRRVSHERQSRSDCGSFKRGLIRTYHDSRLGLTGVSEMLEIKHQVRKPLGWRTRGQATLIEGTTDKGDDTNIVLAKGGIWTTDYLREVRPRNDYIVDLFAKRKPDTIIPKTGGVGIREMIEHDADFVYKVTSKRLNMEFDWKRRPSAVWFDESMQHVALLNAAVGDDRRVRQNAGILGAVWDR